MREVPSMCQRVPHEGYKGPMKAVFKAKYVIRQSNVTVAVDRENLLTEALRSLLFHRLALDAYVKLHPEFKYSLQPVKVESHAPKVARLAAEAAEIAGVGPLAAVAGALAEAVMWDLVSAGAKLCVVENGGEISALSPGTMIIGVYAGPSPLSGKVGLELVKEDFPVGVATSSASVSKAINFGKADAAVAVADEASIADAAAKAICNAVMGDDVEASVKRGLDVADDLRPYIRGALVVRGSYLGVTGRLPKVVRIS